MSNRPNRSCAIVLGALLALSACTGGAGGASANEVSDTEAARGPTVDRPVGDQVAVDELDDELQRLVSNVAVGYRQVAGVWPGFDPNDHPAVIVRKDEAEQVVDAVAFNHPAPDELGTATTIEGDELPFRSVHRIVEPTDRAALSRVESFEFRIELGGVDAFAMVASATDDFFDPTTKDYVSTLLHEMFHRYQERAFQPIGGQDIEGYAYTADNLALAVLEERALADAIAATEAERRAQAAARFAAIRQTRLAADPRVALDNSQEIIEGTARYLEHRLGDQPDSGYRMDATNYGQDLVTDFDRAAGVKETFGFGRWYASGAAALRLLDLLGVDDVAVRVEAGTSPAEILAAELDVTEGNRTGLVADARSAYDPDGRLDAEAEAAAARALDEGPVFGDESDGGSVGGADGDGVPLTGAELACLAEQGVDVESEAVEITDEQWQACVA